MGLKRMLAKLKPLMPATAFLVLLSCAAASFKSTWRAPGEAPFPVQGQVIAALFASDVEATRRNAEEAMAAEINARGAKGHTAYSFLDAELTLDRPRAFERLRQAGVEKVLVMRAVASEPDAFRVYPWGGSRFGGWWGGHGWGWGVGYDPAYGFIDTLVSIETRFYDVAADRLLWAGVSQFRNPTDVVSIVRRLAAEAFAQMAWERLID
jgi:hypothetical protein